MRIAVAALLLLAAAAPVAAAPWLSRAAWPVRAPRAGIAAWLACSLSAVVSSALAGVVLAIPCAQLSTDPGDLLYYDGIGHVTMYVGGGYMIDAPQTGMNVQKIPMNTGWYASTFVGAARP
jgi:hypothetical protein